MLPLIRPLAAILGLTNEGSNSYNLLYEILLGTLLLSLLDIRLICLIS